MSGFVGFLGRRVLDLQKASGLVSHRGSKTYLFEGKESGIVVLSDDDGCFHSEQITVAVSGSGYRLDRRPLVAADLAREYADTGTIDTSSFLGTYSFAIVDEKSGRVLLGRDQIGANPLFVIRSSDGVFFATEYKTLLSLPNLTRQVNVRAVNYFLSTGWNIPGTTFFCEIEPVQPGRLAIHTRRSVTMMDLPDKRGELSDKDTVTTQDLLSALEEAIDVSLLVSGPRVGLMLSGGIDSALIGALLKRKSSRPIISFTVGYGEDDPEVKGARETARILGLDHHEVILSLDQFDKLVAPAVWTMENACGLDEYPCLYGLLQSMSGKVDTVFSGNFSDTIFAGMATHREIWESNRCRGSHGGGKTAIVSRDVLSDPVELVSDPSTYPALSSSLEEELSRALTDRDERMGAQEQFVAAIGADLIMPYTHSAVVDVALKSTDAQKLDTRQNKIILREAASQILPREISERPKHIQQMPYDLAMQEYLSRRLDEIIEASDLVSRRYVRLEYLSHVKRLLSHSINVASIQKTWNIIAFDQWCRSFIR